MVGSTFLVKTDPKRHELRNDCGGFFVLFADPPTYVVYNWFVFYFFFNFFFRQKFFFA